MQVVVDKMEINTEMSVRQVQHHSLTFSKNVDIFLTLEV